MGIKDLMNEEMVVLELGGNRQDEVLDELTDHFVSQGIVKSKGDYLADVKRRESLGSTCVGLWDWHFSRKVQFG